MIQTLPKTKGIFYTIERFTLDKEPIDIPFYILQKEYISFISFEMNEYDERTKYINHLKLEHIFYKNKETLLQNITELNLNEYTLEVFYKDISLTIQGSFDKSEITILTPIEHFVDTKEILK